MTLKLNPSWDSHFYSLKVYQTRTLNLTILKIITKIIIPYKIHFKTRIINFLHQKPKDNSYFKKESLMLILYDPKTKPKFSQITSKISIKNLNSALIPAETWLSNPKFLALPIGKINISHNSKSNIIQPSNWLTKMSSEKSTQMTIIKSIYPNKLKILIIFWTKSKIKPIKVTSKIHKITNLQSTKNFIHIGNLTVTEKRHKTNKTILVVLLIEKILLKTFHTLKYLTKKILWAPFWLIKEEKT